MKKILRIIIPLLLSLLLGILGLGFGADYGGNSPCIFEGFLGLSGYESCGDGFVVVGLVTGAIVGILITQKFLRDDIANSV